MRYFVIEANGNVKMQYEKPKAPYRLRNKGVTNLIDKQPYEVYALDNTTQYIWNKKVTTMLPLSKTDEMDKVVNYYKDNGTNVDTRDFTSNTSNNNSITNTQN